MGSLMFLSPGNFQFSMAAIYFVIACKKLKSARTTQINQLFQLFNLICAYGYTFCGLTLMLMSKDVNNNVSKDLLIT